MTDAAGEDDITPEAAAAAATIGILATLILIGFSVQEAVDALDEIEGRHPTREPQDVPPPPPPDHWESARAKLWTNAATPPTLTEDEYISYVRKVEQRFPDASPADLVNAMHRGNHGLDLDRAMPMFDKLPDAVRWRRMAESPNDQRGAELGKYLDHGTSSVPGDQLVAWRVPRNITINGLTGLFDVSHAIAGIRALQGREHLPRLIQDVNVWAQTHVGDNWQSVVRWVRDGLARNWQGFFNPKWDPPEQYRGDSAGNYLADFYRNPENKNVKLSDAMRRYFDLVRFRGSADW